LVRIKIWLLNNHFFNNNQSVVKHTANNQLTSVPRVLLFSGLFLVYI